jgi:group I intron endonuclease
MKSGIYRIRNLINNKIYIGSSKDLEDRWNDHKRDLNYNTHHCDHLQNAWNKYGEKNFVFEIINECSPIKELLLFREQCWLDTIRVEYFDGTIGDINHNLAYNTCKIAGSSAGTKASEETRKKQSEAKKGKRVGEEASLAKLTWVQVREIRKKYANDTTMSCTKLSKIYNVTSSVIKQILSYRTWIEDDGLKEQIEDIKKKSNAALLNNKRNLQGEKNGLAKLTWEKVKEIREKYVIGNYTSCKLAKEYAINKSTILRIINNRTWYDPEYKFEKLSEEEVKRRMSENRRGEKSPNFGRHFSEETKQKLSESHKGHFTSEETKEKMSVCHRGEKCYKAKLTWDQVNEIREKYSTGNYSQRQLAKEYKIAQPTIEHIINNKTWFDANYHREL